MAVRASLRLVLALISAAPFCADAASATDKLKEGDNAVASGFHTAAVRHYTDAVGIDPNSPLIYVKRAAAYVALRKPQEAIKDLGKALAIDEKMTQALLNRGKIHRSMGNFDAARADFDAILSMKAGHKAASQELGTLFKARDAYEGAKRQLAINDFHGAHLKLRAAIDLMPDFPAVLMLQSQVLSKQGQHDQVVAGLGKLLKAEPGNIDALIMRGWAYLHLGDEETGTRHFREALRFDPEHASAKESYKQIKSISKFRNRAQESMSARDLKGAEESFSTAVQVDESLRQLNLPMLRELCRLRLQLSLSEKALEACEAALGIQNDLADCDVNRVKAMLKLERWDEAANQARMLTQKYRGNGQVHQLLNEAEQALKISKRKDYYKILQVDRRADLASIKRQYRQMARVYHPDKVQGDEAAKAASEKKFQEVAEAYEVLSDPEKRSRYDRGEDVDQPQDHQHHHGGGGQRFHFRYH